VEQVLQGGVCWYQWEGGGGGEMLKEGEYGANTVYTCMKMEKMTSVEPIPGIRGEEIKGNGGGGEFKYDIFNIL
jgi:hypothetical protein